MSLHKTNFEFLTEFVGIAITWIIFFVFRWVIVDCFGTSESLNAKTALILRGGPSLGVTSSRSIVDKYQGEDLFSGSPIAVEFSPQEGLPGYVSAVSPEPATERAI